MSSKGSRPQLSNRSAGPLRRAEVSLTAAPYSQPQRTGFLAPHLLLPFTLGDWLLPSGLSPVPSGLSELECAPYTSVWMALLKLFRPLLHSLWRTLRFSAASQIKCKGRRLASVSQQPASHLQFTDVIPTQVNEFFKQSQELICSLPSDLTWDSHPHGLYSICSHYLRLNPFPSTSVKAFPTGYNQH